MKQIRSFFSVLLLGISLIMVCVPSLGADFQKGLDAYNRGDFEAALREWMPLADQGNASAQYRVGTAYDDGFGVPRNRLEAMRWYRKSAEQGDADAQFNLGYMYQYGICRTDPFLCGGVARSNTEAVKWYRKAAEQGNAYAQYNLGEMYRNGLGVAQSDTEAVKWYRKAAEQGDTNAHTSLKLFYPQVLTFLYTQTQSVQDFFKKKESDSQTNADDSERVKELENDLGIWCLAKYYHPVAKNKETKAVVWYQSVERSTCHESQIEIHPDQINEYLVSEVTRNNFCKLALAKRTPKTAPYIDARERLRLDCKVEQRLTANEEPKAVKPANQVNAYDSERVKELEKRLALLEAQTKQTEQAIASDNTPPTIHITSSTTEGLQARISAEVTDNVSVGEVTLNGSLPKQINGSTYYWETFIPSDGLSVLIEAVDQRGLMSRKSTRIVREKTTETVTRLAAVNPLLGPKQKPSRDRAALIIGLEKYAVAQPAQFASRDAQMFADYAREKLGIPAGNVKVLTDSGASEREILTALKVWLPTAVKPDTTDLYVFYAGHGMPTADGSSAYLVPYDGDVRLLEDTAISRKRFFDEIGAAKPRSATFFFDNCYSGATRSEELLLTSRPLSIKVEETDVPDNYLVFSAGESNQTAGVLDEVKHGRFSYFVFKGLEGEADANQDGKISAGELHRYVRESVGRFSAGAQTPTMLGDAGRWVLR